MITLLPRSNADPRKARARQNIKEGQAAIAADPIKVAQAALAASTYIYKADFRNRKSQKQKYADPPQSADQQTKSIKGAKFYNLTAFSSLNIKLPWFT